MLKVCEKIKKAGIVPWAQQAYWPWLQTSTLTGLLKSTGTWDKLDTNKDDFVTSMERFEGIVRGDWSASAPELKVIWEMARDWWVPYCPQGFLGMTGQEAQDMFLRGEGAFHWNGTWFYPTVKNDPNRKFEFRVVRFPDCSERMAAIGKGGGKTTYPGGACDQMCLTKTASQKGNIELCIDFLKYYMSCDGQTLVCQEHGGVPPVIKCAKGNPELEQFAPAPGETLLKTVHMQSMNAAYFDAYVALSAEWLSGRITYEELVKRFQVEMEKYAKDAVERAKATKA